MSNFPALDATYVFVPKEPGQRDFDGFACTHCGNWKHNESCIITAQNTCAELNWNSGWCREQRDASAQQSQPIQGEE